MELCRVREGEEEQKGRGEEREIGLERVSPWKESG